MNWHPMIRMGLWAMVSVLLVLAGCRLSPGPAAATAPWAQSLSGSDWQVASFEPGQGVAQKAFADGYPEKNAMAAMVPGDVHWDLERQGKIPPIFYGTNSQQIGWVAGKEWWYRKSFTVPAGWQGKTIRLQFDGVDYLADIWLNGQLLGRHEGQFTPFEFEVTGKLHREGENLLVVLIHPAPAAPRQAIAAGAGEWGVAPIIRQAYPAWKCMTNAGWDWGCKILTMGIWKDVRLVASEGVCLADPIVLPYLDPPYDQATLRTRLEVTAETARTIELDYRVRCLTVPGPTVRVARKTALVAGANRVELPIELAKPQLWWPNGYGKQHLYELEITARTAGTNQALASIRTTFGIRDLKMLKNPDCDTVMTYVDSAADGVTRPMPTPRPEFKYLMQINGRRIFARGGNWIPCDLLYGRPRLPEYEHLIRLAALANYNLFRVWGGGVFDKPEFFDMCDRYGIMLFQEFPYSGPRPIEDDEHVAITGREIRQILPHLINHPSIVRYGGGNEMYIDAQTSRQMAQMRSLCNELDPTRPFHDPDPELYAQRHGAYGYEGQEHYQRYTTGYPWDGGPLNPLEWTEYGVSGAASVESLKSMMPAADLWPIKSSNPNWIWHKGFHAYGADTWLYSAQYLHLFGELPDLESTVRCSQFLQAEGLRYANQAMRRFKWHRSACASWTYNEPWPNAAHGCIVEYSGRTKMAYYYTRDAFAPVDVSAEYPAIQCQAGEPFPLKLFVTSSRGEALNGCRLTATVVDIRGRRYDRQEWPLDVAPDLSRTIGMLELKPPQEAAGSVLLVHLQLRDAQGAMVSTETYTFGVIDKSSVKTTTDFHVPVVSADGRRNLALLPGAKATASSVIEGYDIHQIAHLNDGWYGNIASWIEGTSPSWFQIDLGAVRTVSRISIGNDHTKECHDRGANEFRILASTEATDEAAAAGWQTVATYKGASLYGAKTFDFAPIQARRIRVAIASNGAQNRIDEIEIYEATPLPADQVAAATAAAVRGPMPGLVQWTMQPACLQPLLSAPATELALAVGATTGDAAVRHHRVTVTNRGKVPALFVQLDLPAADLHRYHLVDNGFTLLAGESRTVEVLEFASVAPAQAQPPLSFSAKAWNSAPVQIPGK